MEGPLNISSQEILLEDTFSGFFLNHEVEPLAAKETPAIISQRSSKVLTKEATYMIYLMLAFTLFAVLGSTVTAFEFFFKDAEKKIKSLKSNFKENGVRSENGKKSLISSAWFEHCRSFLKCFCLVRNGKRILNTASPGNQIDCIQGLRVIGSAWILLTHTVLFYFRSLNDPEQLKPFFEQRISQIFMHGSFAVDLFFVISGFLNAYFFFLEYNSRDGNISWIYFYFKRYIRLTPVYMIVLGFYTTLYTYTGTGSKWPTYDTNLVCIENWWWNLLYINNFRELSMQCMQWTWYLAVDMQLYIIGPLFMISLIRWPRFGYVLIFTCIVGSCASSFILTYWFNLNEGFTQSLFYPNVTRHAFKKFFKYLDIIHTKPYTRIGSYLLGLAFAYFLCKKQFKKNVIKNSKVTLCCGWIVAFSFIWICFFSMYNREKDILMDTALYNGTKSLLFSCSVGWIIYVCITGQAGILNRFLSWKPFHPLSSLTYCVYLIHMIIQLRLFQQSDAANDYNAISLMSLFFYFYVVTHLFAFIVSILFEIPILNIMGWLRKNTKKQKDS